MADAILTPNDELFSERATGMLVRKGFEPRERHYRSTSTVFGTQYPQKYWHPQLGSGVHSDVNMDLIIQNAIWTETGRYNLRKKSGALQYQLPAPAIMGSPQSVEYSADLSRQPKSDGSDYVQRLRMGILISDVSERPRS